MRKLGYILIAASSPFFFESAFEMYLLTLIHGHQMLFFSFIHIASVFGVLLLALSLFAYLCLALFAAIVVALKLMGKLSLWGSYPRMMEIILLIQVIHTILFVTYDRWASALFSGGGI